jgi:hypothetical protein
MVIKEIIVKHNHSKIQKIDVALLARAGKKRYIKQALLQTLNGLCDLPLAFVGRYCTVYEDYLEDMIFDDIQTREED